MCELAQSLPMVETAWGEHSNGYSMPWKCINLAWVAVVLLPIGMAQATAAKQVLVLYENNRLLPANVEADRGLNSVIAGFGSPVEVSAEFLDYPRFGGAGYIRTISTYLREKYQSHPPTVLVAGGNGALDFLLRNRQELFPGAPIVHMGVDKPFIESLKLPADVYGVPVLYDSAATVAQALRWHPKANRLVVITGAAALDRQGLAPLKQELAPFKGRLNQIDFVSGLPIAELRRLVGSLGTDTVIFTPGFFQDGAGQNFTPRESVTQIAAAASVPVYGPYNTFIGTGVVGGRVPTFEAMGEMAGRIVNQLLAGGAVSALDLPGTMPTAFSVDWRQIKRWAIRESDIPAGTLIQFKTPSLWDQYRYEVLGTLALILLQFLFLAVLLLERRRRRIAELAVDKHRFELAHASRLAVAGELTASIAHEINQPLGAILSNVSAARLIVESGSMATEQLGPILEDIRRDVVRASDVIRQLRKLFEKHEVERAVIDLNEAALEMAVVLRAEARRRQVDLVVQESNGHVKVVGDRIQIQQVLINLVLNAMDALAEQVEGQRVVAVSVMNSDDVASIEVSDTGHGIKEEDRARLFDSFFSTKATGIGLGLSIVRTLVESHGGSVRAENRPSGGAVFRIELPASKRMKSLEAAWS
jgi:signal transduction histidine kinase